jgi:flagellar hook-basal body complex protein FliE
MDGLSIKNSTGLGNAGKVISQPQMPKVNGSVNGPSPQSGVSFADTLKDAFGKVNDLQTEANTKMEQLATGETTDIADVKIAAEKADIALRLMTSVRNKMIDAYHEIMKMQV